MKTHLKTLTLIALCCCLTSCFVPETFTATLNVDKAQNYKFVYDGTIAFGPALGQIKQRGSLLPADEAKLKEGAVELGRKEPGFKTIEYAGAGRYKVHYEDSGAVQAGKKIFLNMVEFRVGPDGRIWILGADIDDKGRQQLSAVDLKLDGQLKITSDLNVVQNNASSTPSLGGLIASYQWHITLDQKDRPTIVLKP